LLRTRTRVPSLYVHGHDDGCMGVELVDGVERAYAGPVRVERLDGGHFVHLENAERFNALLLAEWNRPRT
jgi:pimeloyl-ACP methyl ester carboxylesterase